MSVVEKGIDHAFLLQRRLTGGSRNSAWCSAAALWAARRVRVLRAAACAPSSSAAKPPPTSRAQIATRSAPRTCRRELVAASIVPKQGRLPDIVIEATGARRSSSMRWKSWTERRAVPAHRHRRLGHQRRADRSHQSAARARQPGGVRQRQRQPAPLRKGARTSSPWIASGRA